MRSRILIILITLLAPLAATTLHAGIFDWFSSKKGLPPTIKVLIVHDQPTVDLDVQGRYKIIDPNTDKLISLRTLGKHHTFEAKPEGLSWGEEFPGVHQLKIVPEATSGRILVDGVEYLGSIYIYDVGGTVGIVNELGVENYLDNILTHEHPHPMPKELLAAIAIAARTKAIYDIEHPKTKFWAVDGQNVGYHGILSAQDNSQIRDVIKLTKNMVLSRTGTYEGVVTTFPAYWGTGEGGNGKKPGVLNARITLAEAEKMAQEGKDAALILGKAFPNSHIELVP